MDKEKLKTAKDGILGLVRVIKNGSYRDGNIDYLLHRLPNAAGHIVTKSRDEYYQFFNLAETLANKTLNDSESAMKNDALKKIVKIVQFAKKELE